MVSVILYLDCFSGISGDMLLGALVDAGVAGVSIDDLRGALGSLAIGPETVWTERVVRTGISATRFCVRGQAPALAHAHATAHEHHEHDSHDHDAHAHAHDPDHEHDAHDHHGHSHGGGSADHEHRTLPEIYALIDGSRLSPTGKARAKELFARLGEAEGAIHGTPPEKVHLHEVGALDSIIDIVGSVFALEALGAEEIVASPLNLGSGTIHSAHGLYPVPAPATVRLLAGAPVYAGTQQAELVTPTGALLVSSYARRYGPLPPMQLRQVGYGAGSRDFADTPNVLRVLIGDAGGAVQSHTVVVIECEIDDMNPQIFGVLMDRVLAAGALDVFYTSVQMKKNRPGTLLTIVAPPALREAIASIVFRETTTIGVRYREMTRECLDREEAAIETPLGAVRFKIARRAGEVVNVSPEFGDVLTIAERHGRPIKDVQAMATRAFLESREPRAETRKPEA